MPGLPTFKELKDAGVKRISMGNFLHAQAYQLFEEKAMRVVSEGSFQTLFS
jgi:2-methylisocitrate lyase-like PEP mutase family enzyme